MKCLCCQKETSNPKYCSRSCAAKVSNKTPKRKKTKVCKTCSECIFNSRTYCSSCWDKRKTALDMTLEEAIYDKHHKSSAFALIRSRARTVMKNVSSCQNCGYSKHVEICHVRPISKFPKDTLISEINDKTNLVALCRNCHWEFDHLLRTRK